MYDEETRERELVFEVFNTAKKWTAMKNAAFNYFGELQYGN